MSGLFNSSQVNPSTLSGTQESRINQLWDLVFPKAKEGISKLGGEYKDELVAPLTDLENKALSKFSTYMDTGLGTQSPEYLMAQKEMGNIFGDYYDPWKKGGPIEYTTRKLKETLTNEMLPAARHKAAGKGNFFTQGMKDTEEDIIGSVMDDLAKYSYGEEDALRNLRASMIPQAVSMSADPINRLMETMSMSGYERTQYTQPANTAKYNEFIRLAQELGIPLQAALNLTGQNGQTLAYPQFQPSQFESTILPLLNMGTKIGSSMILANGNKQPNTNSGVTISNSGSGVSNTSLDYGDIGYDYSQWD
uniref:Uncharacterized protein n=1 Tax=viral metagenome TaxID=1070528 RepID=A0A6H1ZWA7_9ZZZZ